MPRALATAEFTEVGSSAFSRARESSSPVSREPPRPQRGGRDVVRRGLRPLQGPSDPAVEIVALTAAPPGVPDVGPHPVVGVLGRVPIRDRSAAERRAAPRRRCSRSRCLETAGPPCTPNVGHHPRVRVIGRVGIRHGPRDHLPQPAPFGAVRATCPSSAGRSCIARQIVSRRLARRLRQNRRIGRSQSHGT